jgi:hypothetical protein
LGEEENICQSGVGRESATVEEKENLSQWRRKRTCHCGGEREYLHCLGRHRICVTVGVNVEGGRSICHCGGRQKIVSLWKETENMSMTLMGLQIFVPMEGGREYVTSC